MISEISRDISFMFYQIFVTKLEDDLGQIKTGDWYKKYRWEGKRAWPSVLVFGMERGEDM